MAEHKAVVTTGLHVAAHTVADAAARAALVASLVAGDRGRLIHQLDTGSWWKCTAAATVQQIPGVWAITNITIPPSDGELDTAFGTAAANGAGFMGFVDDNNAHTNVYVVVSDGTNWWYAAMTKAT